MNNQNSETAIHDEQQLDLVKINQNLSAMNMNLKSIAASLDKIAYSLDYFVFNDKRTIDKSHSIPD